jgi:hypothetical protein
VSYRFIIIMYIRPCTLSSIKRLIKKLHVLGKILGLYLKIEIKIRIFKHTSISALFTEVTKTLILTWRHATEV